jgi:hypothetical protein
MNSKSRSSTVVALSFSFAGPVLLAAALASGCSSGTTTTKESGGTTTGAGGSTTSTGGTTTSAGGSATSAGGSTTSAGGSATSTGGTTTSAGGTTTSAGGTTTSAGGDAPAGGSSTNAGGTANRSGGNTTGAGGTASVTGGTAARTGGSSPAGGTSAAGGTTSGAGGTSAGGTTSTSTSPGWGAPVTGGPTGTGTTATVTVNPNTTVGTIGADYAGFSYEKTHIMNGSLTGNNANLIALYKLLGSPMMRIGANDVEVCSWAGNGTAPTQPNGQPFNTKVTTGGVDQLCAFLAATNGSKVIYGVNFRLGNVTASAAEAAYVVGKCPSSVVAIEIGNEPDKFGTWASQQTQYESFATAILAAPGALLAGPGATSGSATSFSAPFADAESAKWGSKLTLLTQHSYVAGAGSSGCSLANLQITTTKLTDIFTTMQGAATKNKIALGWRMGENNTCSGHGQQGLSDTFISALWALDYMFESAKRGASGINFHNGELGMDGTVPFYYEPIKEQNGVVVQVQPEYYGMLLFSQAGVGSLVSTTVTGSAQNFTAWAIKANGFTSVVLNNRNASSAVSATVNLGAAAGSASAIYLQGTPAGNLTAAAGNVTLAGSQVTSAGAWARNPPYIQTVSGNNVSVYVPAASAALVRVLP